VQASKLIPVEGELRYAKASYQTPSGWKTYRPPSWQLVVEYTYQFNGVLYEGTDLRIGGNGMMFESLAARKAVEMMAANKTIIVWVNPNHPNFSVLERTIGLIAWVFWILLIVVIWVIHHFSPRIKSANPILWESKSSKKINQASNVLEVADSYLAYGRTAQAISVLEDALKKFPQRQDIVEKLIKLKELPWFSSAYRP
jgi:hypothetical protein